MIRVPQDSCIKILWMEVAYPSRNVMYIARLSTVRAITRVKLSEVTIVTVAFAAEERLFAVVFRVLLMEKSEWLIVFVYR